jgi:hypothetical protein
MRISELLAEAIHTIRLRAISRGVLISNSWNTTWNAEHSKFGDLNPELRNFLIDKCYYDPPPAHGKKDYMFSSAYVADLKGISHAHMQFGKVVIIYEVLANHVRLYVAGDHKIVESGGLPTLGRTIKRLKDMPWQPEEAPVIPVTNNLAPEVAQAVSDWLDMLASEPARLNDLYKFAQNDKLLVPLLPYMSWEPQLKKLSVGQLQQLVIAHLKPS